MDLLDIRKKAREKKEAEEARKKAEQSAAATPVDEQPVPEESPEAPAREAAPQKEGKKRRHRPKKAAAKKKDGPVADAPPEDEPQAAMEAHAEEPLPEDDFLLGDDEMPEDEPAIEEEPVAAAPAPNPPAPPAPPKKAGQVPPETTGGNSGGGAGGGPDDTGPADTDEDYIGPVADGSDDEDIIEYLAFQLADEEYAVKVADVKEIIRLQKTTIVPRAQDFVEGIISLRGVIIPVFDIKKRLGFADNGRSRTNRIVILSEGGNPQGIIVDKVTGVARLNKSGIEPPPSVIGGVEAEYIEGLGRIDGRLLILFRTDTILSMEVQRV